MSMTEARLLAVVTGASSGIGLELARQFGEHGFDLVICADGPLDGASRELSALGVDVTSVRADLATKEGVFELEAAVDELARPLDALVLNAGVGLGGNFLSQEPLAQERLVSLNVLSTVRLARHFLPDMVETGAGGILITSSVAALSPGPYEALYGASKAFVRSLALALAEELRDSPVTITALLPGATDTHFFERAGLMDTRLGASDKDDPALVARQGFEAFLAGREQQLAGSAGTRVRSRMMRLLPDATKAAVHRRETEPRAAA